MTGSAGGWGRRVRSCNCPRAPCRRSAQAGPAAARLRREWVGAGTPQLPRPAEAALHRLKRPACLPTPALLGLPQAGPPQGPGGGGIPGQLHQGALIEGRAGHVPAAWASWRRRSRRPGRTGRRAPQAAGLHRAQHWSRPFLNLPPPRRTRAAGLLLPGASHVCSQAGLECAQERADADAGHRPARHQHGGQGVRWHRLALLTAV